MQNLLRNFGLSWLLRSVLQGLLFHRWVVQAGAGNGTEHGRGRMRLFGCVLILSGFAVISQFAGPVMNPAFWCAWSACLAIGIGSAIYSLAP